MGSEGYGHASKHTLVLLFRALQPENPSFRILGLYSVSRLGTTIRLESYEVKMTCKQQLEERRGGGASLGGEVGVVR